MERWKMDATRARQMTLPGGLTSQTPRRQKGGKEEERKIGFQENYSAAAGSVFVAYSAGHDASIRERRVAKRKRTFGVNQLKQTDARMP